MRAPLAVSEAPAASLVHKVPWRQYTLYAVSQDTQ